MKGTLGRALGTPEYILNKARKWVSASTGSPFGRTWRFASFLGISYLEEFL